MDPYLVLGVRSDASDEEVHAAYIRLAKVVHPDRFISEPPSLREEAARRMIELNSAYEAVTRRREGRAQMIDTSPRVCATCPTPDAHRDFQCAVCRTWWSATACAECGAPGYSVGGGGALWHCRRCALARNAPRCPACSATVDLGEPAGEVSCPSCAAVLTERECAYCGLPELRMDGSAWPCPVCRYGNARTA